MSVNLDPKVEEDECPAADPAKDMKRDRVICREMKVGPSEAGI